MTVLCMLVGQWVCRNIHHDDRCWLQNSNNNDRWWESEAADMGHSRTRAL